jgi:hypothetical protein
MFVYYYFLGVSRGDSDRLSVKDRHRLEEMSEIALKGDDIRTARLIDKFLGMVELPFRRRPSSSSGPFDLPIPPEIHRMMDDLAEEIGTDAETVWGIFESFMEEKMEEEEKEERRRRGKGRR